MITIRFDRQTGLAQYRGFAASGSDPYFDVVRQMLDAGEPDREATFIDERGVRCLTTRSIHACARHYRPTPADLEAKRARAAARKAAQ
jgi:hypothetical protein